MKPITALLSPFPPRYRDKESYVTEHASLFTLAARKLSIIVHKKQCLTTVYLYSLPLFLPLVNFLGLIKLFLGKETNP